MTDTKCVGTGARKVLTFLNSVSQKYHKLFVITDNDRYLADMFTTKYGSAPIISLMRTGLNKIKVVEQKHVSFEYWMPMILNTAKNVPVKYDINIELDANKVMKHCAIMNFLISDASQAELEIIVSLVDTFTIEQIRTAITVGMSSNIRNAHYLNGILRREADKIAVKQMAITQLDNKISASRIEEKIVDNTPINVICAQFNWQKAKDNDELVRMFNEKFGG